MESSFKLPGSVIAYILSTGLFEAFDAATFEDLQAELQRIFVPADGILFHQGDAGDSLYVLVSGRLRVILEHANGTTQIIDELDPGVSVGEMALLTGRRRSATVAAIEDAELLQLSWAGFERLASRNPTVVAQFAQSIMPRLRRTQVAGILRSLFGDLSPGALHEIETQLEWLRLNRGKTLFRQGDPGDALFVVVNGRLDILVEEPDGVARLVGQAGSGDSVGESAIVTGETRAETAYAVRDTDVVKFSKASFDRLVEHYPQAMAEITRMIVKRMRAWGRASRHAGSSLRTFAVVAASDDVELGDFCQRLAAALSSFAPVLRLDSAELDRLVGRPGSAQTSQEHPTWLVLANWLTEQETRYGYIVYQADATWSAWSQRCVRQADRVLLVGRYGAAPDQSPIETELEQLANAPRAELVLLHGRGAQRPRGTREWLSRRRVIAHHHVRLDMDADIARLARRLTGRALGLVLGGGGARGFAHLGVIRALQEAGVPIDFVGGTSIGAVVGAFYAMGLDYRAMRVVARKFGTRKQLLDYTVPLVSFFASAKVTRNLADIFGDLHIEDLWYPFFCMSSNLTRALPMVHRSGPLVKYLRASCAMPGVFTPVLDEGDLLVDGVVMNNLPIDVMREVLEGGLVVAVSVATEIDTGTGYDFGLSISGWRVLLNRINPFGSPMSVPSLFATILRSAELFSVHQGRTKRALADLFIYLPVRDFATLDFDQGRRLVDIGYESARMAVQAWLADPQRAESMRALGIVPASPAQHHTPTPPAVSSVID